MKLDGELAFCHPNIGLEPESQSFELNDKNPDPTTCKSRSQKAKENEKRISFDLKSNEGNLVPTQFDTEVQDGLIASKLICPTGIIDFENEDEAKLRNFIEPVSHSSQDTEAPNPKRSHNVSIHDSPKESDSYENSGGILMDECETEHEPELLVCYKDSNYHFVKDICVDEGFPATDKFLFENSVGEKAVFMPLDTYVNEESKKDNFRNSVPLQSVLDLAVTEESDKVPARHHQSQDLIQRDKNATEKLAEQNKEMVSPGNTISLQQKDAKETRPFIDEGDEVELSHAKVSGEPELHSRHEESENMIEEVVLASLAVDELDSDILVSNSNIVPSASVACCSKGECHQDGGCKYEDTQNTSKPEDGKTSDQAITSQVCRSLGDSSFSAVGLASSHICYSGSVPFSGSISLRSDSSTTSTRSFAFPILQSEWNSSPVRMAKADRRQHQKRRGWREGLLCCRF